MTKKRIIKYRLKKKYRNKFRIIIFSLLGLLTLAFLYPPVSRTVHSMTHPDYYGKIKVDRFRDYNDKHIKYARSNGISPFKSASALNDMTELLIRQHQLELISTNKYYVVGHLSHSHPYLTPEAAELLEDIGKRFKKKLKENNLKPYVFQVNSLLRTRESQKNLRKSNVNATSNTSHLYGTTFDIGYRCVIKRPLPWMKVEAYDARAIKLLSEAIGELRREKRCVVVTERIEKCFHITVIQ